MNSAQLQERSTLAQVLALVALILSSNANVQAQEIRLALPAGVERVDSSSTGYIVTDGESQFFPSSDDSMTVHLEVAGDGPFEAEIIVRETGRDWVLKDYQQPAGDLSPYLPLLTDLWDGRLAVAANGGSGSRCQWQTTSCEWRHYTRFLAGPKTVHFRLEVPPMPPEVVARLVAAEQDLQGLGEPVELNQVRQYLVEIALRRIRTDQCYMITSVTGGRGSGSYSGHVAVLGDNPTGLDFDTLAGVGGVMKGAGDLLESDLAQRMLANASESERQQLAEFWEQMSASDPSAVRSELEDELKMWTLTLQDVKFDDVSPGTPLDALTKMAGHFVLTAQLSDDFPQIPDEPAPIPIGVEQVGLKVPGLGLASTNVVGCNPPDPKLHFKLCPGKQWQELDRMGVICGSLEATVCNEQLERLEVRAEFLAHRSLDQCIR